MFPKFPSSIIQQVAYEAFFYVLGLVSHHKEKKFSLMAAKWVKLSVALFVVFNIIKAISGFTALKFFTAITGIMSICGITKIFENKKLSVLGIVGNYSMDIYIMANLIQVFTRSVFLYRLQFSSIVCCIISIFLGVALPILLSKNIVRKSRLLSALILGVKKKQTVKCTNSYYEEGVR